MTNAVGSAAAPVKVDGRAVTDVEAETGVDAETDVEAAAEELRTLMVVELTLGLVVTDAADVVRADVVEVVVVVVVGTADVVLVLKVETLEVLFHANQPDAACV